MKEDKFFVLNRKDMNKYLTSNQRCQVFEAGIQIFESRQVEGKKDNKYLVVNTDEPYADEVIEILKRHGHWG